MKAQVEAVYENGVFRPKVRPAGVADRETVCLTIEHPDLLRQQAHRRISLDPEMARQIGDSDDFGILES